MSFIVSSFIPFPNIGWWLKVTDAGGVLFDGAEHFQKMSYRNRYYISGANGLIQLSIPLAHGRNQRCAVGEVQISDKESWQVQHWRTLVSVYSRTPYFLHYEPSLKEIYDKGFTRLADFNLASVQWLNTHLKANIRLDVTKEYVQVYDDDATDLRRHMKPGMERQALDTSPYYQIFEDRTGFLPNLSMLDLLFSEGPNAMHWLRSNKELVSGWM